MARPRTPLIDKQEVLEKALEIVERDGVDRLSVRALGEALGVKWASLYYHFEDKDAILDGVAKLALVQRADINVDQSAPWDEQIVALSVGVYRTLMRHPNLVALLVRRADRAFADREPSPRRPEADRRRLPTRPRRAGHGQPRGVPDRHGHDRRARCRRRPLRRRPRRCARDPSRARRRPARPCRPLRARRPRPARRLGRACPRRRRPVVGDKTSWQGRGQNTIPAWRHERRSSSSAPRTELSTSSVS